MTPEEARELRHELRTPVNHLIGYAELLLEEDDAEESDVQALQAVRAHAREVLELVPALLGDGPSLVPVSALTDLVGNLTATVDRLAATTSLPRADVERLSVAAIRLGALAARLTEGPLLVQRDVGDAAAPLKGRLETVLVVDDDEDNRNVLAGGQPSWATASSRPATASKHWKHSLSPTPASTSCCST